MCRRARAVKPFNGNRLYPNAKIAISATDYDYWTDLSHILAEAIDRNAKSVHYLDLLGCSIEALKEYLEFKFKRGMRWDNYGDWHIDHILPCCSFDLSNPEQQRQCFHWTNLQGYCAICPSFSLFSSTLTVRPSKSIYRA
jgi:hypothetical protein